MNPTPLIASFAHFSTLLPPVVADISPDDARWKPADGAWSILKITCRVPWPHKPSIRLLRATTLVDLGGHAPDSRVAKWASPPTTWPAM